MFLNWVTTNTTDPPIPALLAKVVTFPLGVILRIKWLSLSQTKAFTVESIAILIGPLNLATGTTPSVDPESPADPAKVVTTPLGKILRIK